MTQLMLIAALLLVGAGAFAIIEIHYRKIKKEEEQRVAAMLECLDDPDYSDLEGIEDMVERNLSDEDILRRCRHRRQFEVFQQTYQKAGTDEDKENKNACCCAEDLAEGVCINRKKTA